MVQEVAFAQRARFHSQFQFLWMDDMETVNNIAMSFLSTPNMMIMATEEHVYYMPATVTNMTISSLVAFLVRITDGKEQAYGGTGFLMGVRRVLFDLVSLIVSIWQASRWLFLLMFGLPTVIISIICYSLCCLETIDDLPDDDEDDEDAEERERLYDAPPPPLTSGKGDLPAYGVAENLLKSKEEKKNE